MDGNAQLIDVVFKYFIVIGLIVIGGLALVIWVIVHFIMRKKDGQDLPGDDTGTPPV